LIVVIELFCLPKIVVHDYLIDSR